jgi:CRP-like cAMP-binding protein
VVEQCLSTNALLAGLPPAELATVRPLLRVVEFQVSELVYRPRQAITSVYFPLSAVFSMLTTGPDEFNATEVGSVGLEGMVGLPLFLGSLTSPHAVICRIAGLTVRLDAADFYQVLSRGGHLHRRLNRFTQATMMYLAQNVLCNQSHTLAQRAARWLLTTGDRVCGDRFVLTERTFAHMLGVGDEAATRATDTLRKNGLVDYEQGELRILDHAGLRNASCECYALVKAEFAALASYR